MRKASGLWVRLALSLGVAAATLSPITGCSSPAKVCVPGQQISCACPGAGQGAQACNAEGSGYEACNGCSTGSADASGLPSDAGPAGDAGSPDAGPTAATIQDLTTGATSVGVDVSFEGVVAMSQKFLVSLTKSTNACLWGVFVSAPGLTETAANTGTLVASYGTPATVPSGGTSARCPLLGASELPGDAIPDDVKPGDVLNVVGKTAYSLPSTCTAGDSQVAGYQISPATQVTKVGTATPPVPHVMTSGQIAQLASGSDKAFHDQWGAVKVRLQNVTSVPQAGAFTDNYGAFYVSTNNLRVGNKLYYRGYLKATDACRASPTEPSAATTFTRIDGFSYLDFCTWSLDPNDKCADLAPPSSDCASATACAQ